MRAALLLLGLCYALGGCARPLVVPDGVQPLAGARFEDADVRAEVSATGRRAVRLRLVNKTELPLAVGGLIVVADHVESELPAPAAEVAPGAERLVELRLPPSERLELIVPTVVRGTPREYHYHLRSDRHWRM